MTEPAAETRVAVLMGDRLCVRCGYNLVGQPVVREPHYDMLIVRCPECAEVASLQEHPVLGRWAGRWAMLLAGLWFIIIVALAISTSGMLYSLADSVARKAITPYATALAEAQLEYLKDQQLAGTLAANWQYVVSQPPNIYLQADPTWWSSVDRDALFERAGGWRGAIDWNALRGWIGLTIWCVPVGIFWSVALLHWRRRWLALAAIALLALGAFMLIPTWMQQIGLPIFWQPMVELALRERGLPVVALTIAFALLPLTLAMILGRPILRSIIRLLLPPRWRAPLAALWLADGLDPPAASAGTRDQR